MHQSSRIEPLGLRGSAMPSGGGSNNGAMASRRPAHNWLRDSYLTE